jgi:pimeloyl-ACP methyl ester carboxylesterase
MKGKANMNTKHLPVTSGRTTTEGDDLYYEVRGQGHPLLMIPPAGGDGWQYSFVADLLTDEYKVITYDRRANSRSTMNTPQNFEISQQSRDAVAVLRAVGETSAFVFGNSSGAVIALDMAKTQPQAVRAIIAHEPPIPRVHPNARKLQSFFARVYATAFRFGSYLALLRFMLGVRLPLLQLTRASREVNIHREQSRERYISTRDAADFLVKQELLPVTNYLPDVATIKKNEVSVFMGVGAWSQKHKAWYAQTAQILAEQLACPLVIFPGHHGSFLDMPEWATTLRNILHKAETVKQSPGTTNPHEVWNYARQKEINRHGA